MFVTPLAVGSYLVQWWAKLYTELKPTLMRYSVDVVSKPSKMIAMKRLRNTRLTISVNPIKNKYEDVFPHPLIPSAYFCAYV